MDNQTIWNIIDSYFEENPHALVQHHLDSYNDFFKKGIFQLIRDKNPILLTSTYLEKYKDHKHKCRLYIGGKNGDKLYFGKPVIYDNDDSKYMFPNEARLRNMTYGMTIHYDVDVEFTNIIEEGEIPTLDAETVQKMIDNPLSDKPLNIYGEEGAHGEENYDEENAREHIKKRNSSLKNYDSVMVEMNDTISEAQTERDNEELQKGGALIKKKKIAPSMAHIIQDKIKESMVQPNIQTYTVTLNKLYMGKFPIMVQSDFCILKGLPRSVRHSLGECKNDVGGYFIIDGKEKTVIVQEKFGDNMLYIRKENPEQEFLFTANLKSVSENAAKPIRTLNVAIVAPTPSYTNLNIVVVLPNVRRPIPLFILFRALGIISDKDIITTCLLDIEKYDDMLDDFIPSIHDTGGIFTQQDALMFIANATKYNTPSYALEILNEFFLPHIGENNYIEKAYFLGNIVFRLLRVYKGIEAPTDRDNYKFKRVELVGTLMSELFREYYNIQQQFIFKAFDTILYLNRNLYESNLHNLIYLNYRDVFSERNAVEEGFKRAFKGNWGAYTHTKRIGVVQDLNRLSFNGTISHLRKTNLPLDSSVKLVGPRVLHSSHWGFIDPVDTPDGANIGLHKTLAIMTKVSRGYSREVIIQWLKENVELKQLEEFSPRILSVMTKVFVNGYWAGCVEHPFAVVKRIKLHKRNGLLPLYTSATFEIKQNTIYIFTDAGRLCRPIFYKDDVFEGEESDKNRFSFSLNPRIEEILKKGKFTWSQLISGFNKKKEDAGYYADTVSIYKLKDLYEGYDEKDKITQHEQFFKNKAIIDYIDPSESENALIAVNAREWAANPRLQNRYTHFEIHESLIFGVMCNMIIYPENNPVTRNSFSCGQSKQAVSMYHTNYQMRMDKTSVVLNYGEVPLVKSRYMEYINHEENPYGQNAIVAIMCYTGYNVEDAVLINEGAIQRGLFNTTYFTTYEAHEEKETKNGISTDVLFMNIESNENVEGLKMGYDYSTLDEYGIIKEETPVDDKTVLIGISSTNVGRPGKRLDVSKSAKKGQLGIVDRTFITKSEEGKRIAKVRIREQRMPAIGDKMASRAGQKGTIGLIIPEKYMPYTKDGLKPDIIINPHAIPTRMTIGQLVECIIGKACAMYGGFGDCTAFNNIGSKFHVFGEMLSRAIVKYKDGSSELSTSNTLAYHSSGNEILYNGMTGEQIESEIFIGPTYYMRLKHMVKDKINYRSLGPRTALTRQPVSGRANDGGLRIGEMERDVLISHGISNFLTESMMTRGDETMLAICNKTGMVAIYNPDKNLFLSPAADGPLNFLSGVEDKAIAIEKISKFGRSFSIVAIPYSMKLLMQELQAINVQMRIITEDNIDQMTNLGFSNNIQLLTGNRVDSIVDLVKEHVEKKEPIESQKVEGGKFTNKERILDSIVTLGGDVVEGDTHADMDAGVDANKQNVGGDIINEIETTSILNESLIPDVLNKMNISGGSHPIYEIGEQVYFRGSESLGLMPTHIWRIMRINLPFYTIETGIVGSENTLNDSIQVVEAHEIYRPTSVPAIPSMNGGVGVGVGLGGSGINTHNMQQPEMPSNINIAPVIKIVNGSDYSQNSENPDNSATASTQEKVNLRGGGGSIGENITPQMNMGGIGNSSNQMGGIIPEKKEKTFADGIMDFGKLVIRKVGGGEK